MERQPLAAVGHSGGNQEPDCLRGRLVIGRGLAVGWAVLWGGLHSIWVIGIGLEKGLNHWDPLIVGEEGYC